MKPALSTLFITWQEPESRRIYPIARLMGLAGGAYELTYIRAAIAAQAMGFHGLPGFEELKQVYVSAELPRLFEHRLPARGRHAPVRDASELIGDGLDAAPITILVPLGDGNNERLEAFAPPLPTPAGSYVGVFWVRGVGRISGSEDVPLGLQPRERVELLPEPENAYNPRALRVVRSDDAPIGYVPDYLANELSEVAAEGTPSVNPAAMELEVLYSARANFPPAAPLYKVLCRYTCSAELGRRLFYSESYEPLSSRAYRRAPPRA